MSVPSVPRRLRAAFVVLLAALLAALVPPAASAHSLESSTISVHVTDDRVAGSLTVALESLDEALGTGYAGSGDLGAAAQQEIVDYLADHLVVTGGDGTEWTETLSGLTRESVEGIDSVSVDVTLDTAGTDTSAFDIAYDAVIEAVPSHEAVVVLTDASGDVSTAGVITSTADTVGIGGGAGESGSSDGVLDMVGYGFQHVLEGADHLLFLLTLLLTAPMVVMAGRWHRRTAVTPTLRSVLAVVTSFTVGHSVTLIASALGWVEVPATPVEVLVALSVGVAGLHAIRPLVRNGENLIAGGFGLVHGLAFAGILADLGLDGSTSLVALLAFNVGVELAQLAATAALFPSVYLLARTRAYPVARTVGGAAAVAAATGWALERLGVLPNPLGPVEDAAIAHPWAVVAALAATAIAVVSASRRGAATGAAHSGLAAPSRRPARPTAPSRTTSGP